MHVGLLVDFVFGDIDHVEHDSDQDDEACQHMRRVVLEANTATPEEHVERDEELEQRDQQEDWNHISRPEEKESVEHVEHTDDADDAPADGWCAFDIEQLMKALLPLLSSKPTQHEIEEAVQKDDDEDEDISVVFGLIDSHDEAVALHEQGEDQYACHHHYHCGLLQAQ